LALIGLLALGKSDKDAQGRVKASVSSMRVRGRISSTLGSGVLERLIPITRMSKAFALRAIS